MARIAVLKPIMWNDQGHTRPAGCPSTSGYSHDKGYGHEEWNNNPDWLWQGWRVFHTEGNETLRQFGCRGDLLTFASTSYKPFARPLSASFLRQRRTRA